MPSYRERGLIQLLLLLLIIAGIVLGLFLLKDTKIFRSRASVSAPISAQTSFKLTAQSNTVAPGTEFLVKVSVRADIDPANLFAAKLQFPPNLLEVVKVGNAPTFISSWAEEYYDNNTGSISLVGGVPTPGYKTTVGRESALMTYINFRSKTAGVADISFTDEAAIYRDSDNTNILGPKSGLTMTVSAAKTQPGGETVTYDLQAGWNYIGVSVQTSPTTTPGQLLSTTGNKCSAILGFNPAAGAEGYFSDPSKEALNSLTKIIAGKGYSIQCGSPATLALTGSPLATMPSLVAGWQHISLPKGKTITAEVFLNEVSKNNFQCDTVLFGNKDAEGTRYRKGSQDPAITMVDTKGYWVKCAVGVPSPSPLHSPTPISRPTICAQVITPGLHPSTGECKEYSSPCAVPPDRIALKGVGGCSQAGDINAGGRGDGKTNLADLSALLSKFNKTSDLAGADLNGDGAVNTLDFSLMRVVLIQKGIIKGK